MQTERALFKRKNNWPLTAISIVICVLLMPVSTFTFAMPHLFTVIPLILLFLLGYVGPVSALGCMAICIFAAGYSIGIPGVLAISILIIPFMAVSVYLTQTKKEFWLSAAIASAVAFASACLVVSMIGVWAKTDAVSAIIRTVTETVNAQPELSDWLISLFGQMGLITTDAGSSLEIGRLSPDDRVRIIGRIMALFDTLLRLQIPMQISTGSLASGVLGQTVLRKSVIKLGYSIEYPPLRTWRVPKGWGRILGGTFLLLFVLARLVPQYTRGMYYVFSGLFEQVFALQGIAALCWMLEERKRKRITKVMVFLIGYFVLQTPALILGIADQAFDFTKRREKMGDDKPVNPFDPRA